MAIVTQTMLTNRLSSAQLIRLTDDAGSGAVNATVTAAIIAEGESEILGRIGQRYTLPLALTDAYTAGLVATMCTDAACYRLFLHREQGAPEEYVMAHRSAIEWATKIAEGKLGLVGEVALGQPVSQAGEISSETTPRVVSRETMSGL